MSRNHLQRILLSPRYNLHLMIGADQKDLQNLWIVYFTDLIFYFYCQALLSRFDLLWLILDRPEEEMVSKSNASTSIYLETAMA